MKQIIFTVISILAFCSAAFAQANINSCPKIKIKAPETVNENNKTFKVSASFENENSPSISKFDWIVVKDDEVSIKNSEKIIEIDTKNAEREYVITVLAQATEEGCQNPAMAKVIIIPNIGSPLILDEYAELNWNDERARLDALASSMQGFKDSEIFAFLDFDKRSSHTERKNYLTKFLNHLSAVRGLEKNRITFLISESESKRIRFQPVPKNFSNIYSGCDDCLVIKAEDFEKLENLFRPKPTIKNHNK